MLSYDNETFPLDGVTIEAHSTMNKKKVYFTQNINLYFFHGVGIYTIVLVCVCVCVRACVCVLSPLPPLFSVYSQIDLSLI